MHLQSSLRNYTHRPGSMSLMNLLSVMLNGLLFTCQGRDSRQWWNQIWGLVHERDDLIQSWIRIFGSNEWYDLAISQSCHLFLPYNWKEHYSGNIIVDEAAPQGHPNVCMFLFLRIDNKLRRTRHGISSITPMTQSVQMRGTVPRVAIVVRGYDLNGAVAISSLHHAEALAVENEVTIITDTGTMPLRHLQERIWIQKVDIISFHWLRRYAHVPNEFFFIISVGIYLLLNRKKSGFDTIVFHSHPSSALLAPIMKRRFRCRTVMVMHGDIHDRPVGTYDPRLTFWYRITTGREIGRAHVWTPVTL